MLQARREWVLFLKGPLDSLDFSTPFSCTVVLELALPLTEMGTRNLPG
jgi:hypothetical protein